MEYEGTRRNRVLVPRQEITGADLLISGSSTERDADADLAGPMACHIGPHDENANGREDQRDEGKHREQRGSSVSLSA